MGALVLWALLQSAFALPDRFWVPGGLTPATLAGASYRPLIPPPVGVALNLLIAAAFVWWWPLRVLRRREWRRAAQFRLRPLAPGLRPYVVLAGLAIVVAATASLLVLPRLLPFAPESDPTVAAYVRQPVGAVALAVVAVAVAPLMEEFLFRGWVQRRLERVFGRRMAPGATPRTGAPWPAIVVTALLFALVHLQRFGFAPRALFALAAGYAAWATGSIWASVGLHAMYNGGLLLTTPLLGLLVPRLADADDRSVVRLAQDPRVFWPALLVLVAAGVAAARALRGLRAAARAKRMAR